MPQLWPSLPPPLSVTAGQTTVLMKDISEFSAVNGIYSNFFQHHQPARAAFQVSRNQPKLQDIMSPAHRTIKTTCSVYGSVRPVHRRSWGIFEGGPTISFCQNSILFCQNNILSGGANFSNSVLPSWWAMLLCHTVLPILKIGQKLLNNGQKIGKNGRKLGT